MKRPFTDKGVLSLHLPRATEENQGKFHSRQLVKHAVLKWGSGSNLKTNRDSSVTLQIKEAVS